MDALHRRVGIARRRLNLERFLVHLFRSWCAWLVVAVVAIAVRKFWPLAVAEQTWILSSLGVALVAGLASAIIWSYLTNKTELEAAIEIDKRFGLKERVSTALGLDAETRESAAGQALMADTLRRIERLDVGERFRIGLDRSAWWPLAPGALALLIALFITSRVPENPALATPTAAPEQIRKTAEVLQKKLEKRRAEAEKHGLKEADVLLKKLEEGTKDLGNKPPADKQKALVKLNDLAKQLEQRQKKLAMDEQFKQQLNNLKDLKKGPAEAAAQAMKNGDFRKALKEVEELRKKLADGKLNKEEKQQLADQLNQMKDMIEQAAAAHEQAREELKKQVEQARQAGDTQQADKLQQQLDKLAEQMPAMEKLGQLAQQCKACADAMKQGNGQQAQQALDKLGQELKGLAQNQEEMKMLEAALDEIAEAKQCVGEGNQEGMGQGQPMDELAMQGRKNRRGQPGKGIGQGRGLGGNPDPPAKAGFYDSKVNQKVGKGSAQVTDLVDGPNKKGDVTETIKNAFESAKQGDDDPLTGERLPRDYRDHAKEYFDAFRNGQ